MKNNYALFNFQLQHGFQGPFLLLIQVLILLTSPAFAQQILWDRTYGGSSTDLLYSANPTSDGGYIVGGSTGSGISGDKTAPSRGGTDYWIVKLDAAGNKEWDKAFGGLDADYFTSVQQTTDGGYIVGGSSHNGISGDKTEPSRGKPDYWIIKLDAAGNKLWDKTIGGSNDETLTALLQTADGGYVLGGMSFSGIGGDKTEASNGSVDYWIVKLDAAGNKQWDRTLGGSSQDYIRSLIQTSDGAYVAAGESHSGKSGDRSEESAGESDYWIVKLDQNGNKLWDKAYGGNSADWFSAILETEEGGYLLTGMTSSGVSEDKSQPSRGGEDYWVIKTDANGNKLWDKTIGGSTREFLTAAYETMEGNYLIGGISFSGISGDKTEGSKGLEDIWIVSLSKNGTIQWQRTIGGSNTDYVEDIFQTADGGYLLGGYSRSGAEGDKSEPSRGYEDFWVLKLSGEAAPPTGEACQYISFNGENTGLISSTATTAGEVTITGRKRNPDGSYAPESHAAIFDAGIPTGDDEDLHAPDWGKVLIINQDLTSVPNDNQWGGELLLDFSAIGTVTIASLKALDIDTYENDSWVYLYDAAGKELYKTHLQPIGNNSTQTVNLGNTKGVARMRIALGGIGAALVGSAAIDDIAFCVDEKQAPAATEAISQLTAHPNPVTEKAMIEFKLATSEKYTVTLHDLKGNLVREVKTGRAQANEVVKVEIDARQLFSGLYVARIVSDSGSKIIKLILRR
ncbi:T9SS type A sorting domain-containing protein [Pontibacter sp. Tf4]|uniref:T9SS type A sorting domain-containing protein n=1 Tax=Pontibacter sp. Tf4 TaxID=2761620 RepID=UPI001625CFDC|nr:T9SS type A sorting domain-containing protein [Pontibacter sp. Tf4]MBB6612665.1 T9SS type A sorting domain-containing protein [Pontibacter sp. Tf4]